MNENRRNKLLAVAYALKDAVGFSAGGIPIRVNELVLAMASFRRLFSIRAWAGRLSRDEAWLLLLLAVNLLYTVMMGILNRGQIDLAFLAKYSARNMFYVFAFAVFMLSQKMYREKDIAYLCSAIVLWNSVFGVILYITGYRMSLGGWVDTRIDTFQVMQLFGMRFPRFFGTASESGYLGPFLMMPFYYCMATYSESRLRRAELLLLLLFIILSFSIITYLLAFGVWIWAGCRSAKKKRGAILKTAIASFSLLGLVGILYCSVPEFSQAADDLFINKTGALVGAEDMEDFSGSDRRMHYLRCIELFGRQPILGKLLGIGTGGYANSLADMHSMILAAEEAYNIYLSTLLDRGVVGLIILFCIAKVIARFHIRRDPVSDAIYIGIISQYVHWTLTGNFWLCYFWLEVMYLIGYYKWRKCGEQRCLQETE